MVIRNLSPVCSPLLCCAAVKEVILTFIVRMPSVIPGYYGLPCVTQDGCSAESEVFVVATSVDRLAWTESAVVGEKIF